MIFGYKAMSFQVRNLCFVLSFDSLILTGKLLFEFLPLGTIPSELGLLQNITQILLHDNYLTGTVPSEFGLMRELSALSLSNNSITGSIPVGLCGLATLWKVIQKESMWTVIWWTACARVAPVTFEKIPIHHTICIQASYSSS